MKTTLGKHWLILKFFQSKSLLSKQQLKEHIFPSAFLTFGGIKRFSVYEDHLHPAMRNQFMGRTQGKNKFSLFTPISIASLLPLLLPGNSLFQTSCHGAAFPEIPNPILPPSIHMATIPQLKENEIRSG